MAADRPLLSLIVPTRERARTLAFTLATSLDQASRDFEVVVSDNASEDGTGDLVGRIDDPRIRYLNTGRRLSMCDNYEFALENARGDYVIIIGDDDAVMPGALDFLLARLRPLPEPTIHMWPLHIYDWPSGDRPARLAFLARERAETVLDLRKRARRVMGLGGWKYYELPSPYHSAVPVHILASIRTRTGRVFHSTQPDVFTAMAIPAFAERAVNLGRAITLHGRSPQSNGRDFGKRGEHRNIDRFIGEYGDYRFHPTLYAGASPPANMIPDAVLMAKEMFPEIYGAETFDYNAMWAYVCRLRFASHLDVIRRSREIRNVHGIRLERFIAFSAIHELSAVRRKLIDWFARLDRRRANPPGNIQDLARRLEQARATPSADEGA